MSGVLVLSPRTSGGLVVSNSLGSDIGITVSPLWTWLTVISVLFGSPNIPVLVVLTDVVVGVVVRLITNQLRYLFNPLGAYQRLS